MDSSELADLFKALADPTRVEIVRYLASGEVSCVAFDEILPVSKSTVSYHLRALRNAGLIEARKNGKFHFYNLHRAELESALPGFLSVIESAGLESDYEAE
ncbi:MULTISPECIES: helix-turn-helix transcriptional regulator [unclassified Rhodococcus (in: high G+C Gram-positive bacteria)]|uniref:ArsR/SmtB family transcription factor n=1 Tax=unclassified Rhodococcus (in: high G+C Gram-positive bacteria) TaxID=192944 RepID=UPI0015C5C321|nr:MULTISPECIES: metalloregulator ArsR/SmtB family transcription factor [unclassified Rhodococcus (in: high G+C Gram-positive bacteria)]